jgi:hypothetical protein
LALGEHLVFKGGTSLSKGYDVIQRFSEDIDLTYDIREIIPELAVGDPPSCDVMHAHNPTWRRAISVDKVSWWMGKNG